MRRKLLTPFDLRDRIESIRARIESEEKDSFSNASALSRYLIGNLFLIVLEEISHDCPDPKTLASEALKAAAFNSEFSALLEMLKGEEKKKEKVMF